MQRAGAQAESPIAQYPADANFKSALLQSSHKQLLLRDKAMFYKFARAS